MINLPLATRLLLPATLAALLLSGCGTVPGTSLAPTTIAAETARGIVMGGQQPVAGVSLQLYAVGTSGYGSAATPLFPAGSVLTSSTGNFTFPAFTCPTPGTLVYLVGTGGQPIAASGNTPAITNPNLAMMVGLGPCGNIADHFINVNEVTTVASVWALSPFMTGMANIGSSPTNSLGIANAFASINKLVDTSNGHVSGPTLPANATLPVAKINTIADMLEQCVNSAGGSASDTTDGQTNGTRCGKLFFLAGGTSTTDTITAAMVIAQHPGANVAKLNILRSASPVFTPTLSVNAPPTDWTLAVTYTGGGLSSPQGVAADQSGNIYVANPGNNSVSEFDPTGAPYRPGGLTGGGLSAPYAVAIDQNGTAYVANSGNNSVTQFGQNTTVNLTNPSYNVPTSIAIDPDGRIYVGNSGASSVSGMQYSPDFTGGGLRNPTAVIISPN